MSHLEVHVIDADGVAAEHREAAETGPPAGLRQRRRAENRDGGEGDGEQWLESHGKRALRGGCDAGDVATLRARGLDNHVI